MPRPITRTSRQSALRIAHAASKHVECAICLEPGAIALLSGCSHAFHDTCAVKCAHAEMLRLRGDAQFDPRDCIEALTCPLCRRESKHYCIGVDVYTFESATHFPTILLAIDASLREHLATVRMAAERKDNMWLSEAHRISKYIKEMLDLIEAYCAAGDAHA